ncbi:MAG: tetratricopeptide repeat protein [Bryobacteraceae bacterium]
MTRTLLLACLLIPASASTFFPQNQPKAAQKPAQQPAEEPQPPEEDESVAPKVYPLDPLESERNIKVGNFYMHKGSPAGYRAARGRYEDATKYNPSSAEAFFKLGEAEEKLKNKEAAKAAFERAIQLAPDSKLAHDARKKLGNKS